MLSAQPTIRQKFIAGAASVLALLGAANLSGPSAHAQQLTLNAPTITYTYDQCRAIAATTTQMFNLRQGKLSPVFRQAMIDLIMNGGQMTCSGPREIAWQTQEDAATFNTIASQLESPATRIDFTRAGIVLAPRPVVSSLER